ncbi:dihydrolipoyl dehydrogenase [Bacteroidota bacterium]|nr:dihydrolipoyl dehydrogenase [Bacteroidota bacterium]
MTQYDVAIIGSGPGGYVAAIRCAQLGFKTAVIEKYNTLGGTCLNVGCIPSKALLDSTEHYHNAKTTFQKHGIQLDNLKVDFTQMIKRKNEVVKQTCDGVSFLMKKNKIDVLTGVGSFVDAKTISIQNDKGEKQEIQAKHIIIATGSKPASLPNIVIDKERIISSTEALTLKEIPKEMIVIGGGVIGCEMASVYARIGTKVRIVEYLPNLIPTMDKDLSKELERVMRKLGVEMHLGFKVKEVMRVDNEVMVSAEDAEGKTHDWSADYCLMAVGRKPFTENLGLEKAGLKTDEKGRITVNENLQTSVENIFAIGDVVRGAMLAHKAEEEGVFVAEFLAGQKPHINYNLIPGVVYTWPEVAAVGNTEEELIKNKIPFKKGSFPFRASGRARASMDLDGFIKILAHAETDEILGVHMIGPRMADLIMEAVVAMEYRASAEDISRMSHPHPTFSEAFREACLAATENRALHI